MGSCLSHDEISLIERSFCIGCVICGYSLDLFLSKALETKPQNEDDYVNVDDDVDKNENEDNDDDDEEERILEIPGNQSNEAEASMNSQRLTSVRGIVDRASCNSEKSSSLVGVRYTHAIVNSHQ